jgi:hypothetical protein
MIVTNFSLSGKYEDHRQNLQQKPFTRQNLYLPELKQLNNKTI